MTSLKELLEKIGFHLPVTHDWLAERDGLRTKSNMLTARLESLQREYDEARKALWVPPGHFYSPIPAVDELKSRREAIFGGSQDIPGIDLNVSAQLQLLEQFQPFYDEQPFTSLKTPDHRYFFENPNYSYADAIVLYCMMRHLRPRRIIEVGSGYSSCAMIDVDELFFRSSIDFTFIEPYPDRLLLDLITDKDRARLRIFGRNVQDVDPVIFAALEPGDILFIDSSHVSKTGSDVNDLILKVLGSLKAGVYIHFHDIFHGFEYPPEWAFEGKAWNEAYLLRAYLSGNDSFEIRFFTSYLMRYFQSRFEASFPLMLKCPGAGLWLTKVSR